MIGRRDFPPHYYTWNRRWGAPYGFRWRRILGNGRGRVLFPRLVGPFGFQLANNETRYFEYPWAYFATPLKPGMRALEIGGSLSGFQFVLSRCGINVVNVDPGQAAVKGWRVSPRMVQRLNRAFRTTVRLEQCFLQEADLPSGSFERVFSLSTLEHIPPAELPGLVAEIRRLLAPGGKVVLTIDLFLDLHPFTSRRENEAGWNVDVRALVEQSDLELAVGDTRELNGYPEFEPRRILERLSEFQLGSLYPALSQALVLAKSH